MPNINYNFTSDTACRIANCITSDIEALALNVCGVSVNWQTKFALPRKAHFAEWLLATYPHKLADIEAALPNLEHRAEAYKARPNKQGKPMTTFTNDPTASNTMPVQPKPQQQAQPAVRSNVPMPSEPVPQPVAVPAKPEPAAPKPAARNDALAEILRDALGVGNMDSEAVREIIREELRNVNMPQRIEVSMIGSDAPPVDLGVQHKTFTKLLTYCQQRDYKGFVYPVLIPGPAGSGKTTAAQSVATAMGLPFYYTGAVDTEYKLLGFIAAGDTYRRTAFREAFENGGVFLVDEIDGGNPFAYVAMQAALENGFCIFPDAMVTRHKDCIIIAAGNTYGTGATHEYVGRNKLDAATLDRFITLGWDYDEAFERTLAGNDYWVSKVQTIRRAVHDCGIKHVVSPRASIRGAVLLKAGVPEAEVLQSVVFKGLSAEQVRQVQARC